LGTFKLVKKGASGKPVLFINTDNFWRKTYCYRRSLVETLIKLISGRKNTETLFKSSGRASLSKTGGASVRKPFS
jgi:hypothetical protein